MLGAAERKVRTLMAKGPGRLLGSIMLALLGVGGVTLGLIMVWIGRGGHVFIDVHGQETMPAFVIAGGVAILVFPLIELYSWVRLRLVIRQLNRRARQPS